MKTTAQLPKANDGLEQKQNLKLTQVRSNLISRTNISKGSIDFHDEFFFGYTNAEQEKPDYHGAYFDHEDLEVRYGLL